MNTVRASLAIFVAFAGICGAAAALAPAALAQQPSASSAPAPLPLPPGSFKAYAADGAEPRVSNFSGKAVPRYASLKFEKVNGRAGPSKDYPVKWVYERAGLPVIVVRESNEWRKVRDPQGDEVWVDKGQLAEQRTVVTVRDGSVRREPGENAPLLARFGAGAVLHLRDCGALWCQVTAEGKPGWVVREQLWGADPLPVISARDAEKTGFGGRE